MHLILFNKQSADKKKVLSRPSYKTTYNVTTYSAGPNIVQSFLAPVYPLIKLHIYAYLL